MGELGGAETDREKEGGDIHFEPEISCKSQQGRESINQASTWDLHLLLLRKRGPVLVPFAGLPQLAKCLVLILSCKIEK